MYPHVHTQHSPFTTHTTSRLVLLVKLRGSSGRTLDTACGWMWEESSLEEVALVSRAIRTGRTLSKPERLEGRPQRFGPPPFNLSRESDTN